MDPVTHGLIGIALSTLSGHSVKLDDPLFWGCTLGAMLPDLDIVTHVKGRLNYLLKHRGASHSLIALTGMSLSLGTALYLIYPSSSWITICLYTLMGTLSHGIADLLNSYGAELLWPFSRKKYTVDMIMLTDPLVMSLLLISFSVSLSAPSYAKPASLMALLFSGIYLEYRQLDRIKTRDRLMKLYHLSEKNEVKVLPAMYHPFAWNFILFHGDFVRFGIIRNKVPSICKVMPKYDEKHPTVTNALGGSVAELFNQLTPYYHILIHISDVQECNVEFVDLRYWVKGGFLYTGNVFFDEKGEISQEIFYPLPNQEGVLLSY